MPGILPMKMIRVGSSAQSRIAQACDRCRSKKIRCDGVRPCCGQCGNVGFECKTSDKLSRRAFPRGYTESLEDRVRGLEAEVKELKDLLDEKDEKIDMLSRIHSFSPASRKCSASLSPAHAAEVKAEVESAREEILHVEIPAPVNSTATSTGSSTTASFLEAFDQKVQAAGGQATALSSSGLQKALQPSRQTTSAGPKVPPRIQSDQYINLFFQEWQPLLPVLHRPTFLRVYEQYISNPDSGNWQSNKQALAQLYLIFEISALSEITTSKRNAPTYESQWRKALYSTSSNATLCTLQCHVLAEICYMLRADYTHLLRHRGIAVTMCHELGLHQSHRYHSLSPLEAEARKRVFWCQYVLDKFTSATTGTPMLLRDSDITTELPADVDDENITNEGFSPTLPGERTKVSSALALMRVSQILSKTLDNLYPAKATYQLSLNKLHGLSDELDQWSEELPEHLRLRFCNDKPATHMISDRSPLLSMAYFYIRSLIHRPLLCHGSGSVSSAANIVLATSGKHVLQIHELLLERRMNYTFPMDKTELLMNSGLPILWQSVDLEKDSKLVKDNQKSLNNLLGMMQNENAAAAMEFHKMTACFVTLEPRPALSVGKLSLDSTSQRPSVAPVMDSKSKSTRKQLQAIASKWSTFSNKAKAEDVARRATVPETRPVTVARGQVNRAASTTSLSSTRSAPIMPINSASPAQLTTSRTIDTSAINLDYLPFGDENVSQSRGSSSTMLPPKIQQTPTLADSNWDQLLNNLDNNTAFYPDVTSDGLYQVPSNEWAPNVWNISGMEFPAKAPVPQSLLSFSDESLTSGDDFFFSAPPSNNGSGPMGDSVDLTEAYRGITIPVDDEFDIHDTLA
ncbi:fungal-specific transcription factor domain-containing protein [Exophiala viscosa]|uniref:Fungal-specific transcription factor domain-containing protein n=1 Tax=Exophiala viscosa TaxID=2486360 RepID=A0AAN6IDA8_9EURO|nr:fungal-specific transcription factor domain-containing protein [Exophiala viscosa]KAI1626342.1 fungal-specific transcription factor domain-containing protein [Exophiala viscosa]